MAPRATEDAKGVRDGNRRASEDWSLHLAGTCAMKEAAELASYPERSKIHRLPVVRLRDEHHARQVLIWRRCYGWSAIGPNACHSTAVSRSRKRYGATSEPVDR